VELLEKANLKLKAQKAGVTIYLRGGRLYLQATLPPRPGSPKSEPHQQRISLGINANPAGIRRAEAEAKKLSGLIACKEFDWKFYRDEEPIPEEPQIAVAIWQQRFEDHYFSSRKRTHQTLTTWQGDYLEILRKLPADAGLSSDLLEEMIRKTEPDSKTRTRACMVVGSLARFAELPLNFDLKQLRGKYSPIKSAPRELPDDATIQYWHDQITHPGWAWVYGMLATFGLRPSEVFTLDTTELVAGSQMITVHEESKTGERRVWAIYPEWIERFKLRDVRLPNVALDKANQTIGGKVTPAFKRYGVPFPAYNLRHARAVRDIFCGLDISLSAAQMGHSVKVHTDLYHRWISKDSHQRAFDILMNRPDRPLPPT
jgi:integrase